MRTSFYSAVAGDAPVPPGEQAREPGVETAAAVCRSGDEFPRRPESHLMRSEKLPVSRSPAIAVRREGGE
jgi:hypothetical protein